MEVKVQKRPWIRVRAGEDGGSGGLWAVSVYTKVWVGLQVSLHGVDEVPARQEDQHSSIHLQRLDVLEKSLHQLEGRLLLTDLSQGPLGLRGVVRSTDQVTVDLQ